MSGLRVLEIGTLPAGALCARLFADFGAEVVKVEPPGGDPARLASPRIQGLAPEMAGAAFAAMNFDCFVSSIRYGP
jgi:crotonobetainyl-CoA:carnitine CoA-transferase CaiB-like acyl-CoA transferase